MTRPRLLDLFCGAGGAAIEAPANLAAFCEECNLGQGGGSVEPLLWIALMRRRLAS